MTDRQIAVVSSLTATREEFLSRFSSASIEELCFIGALANRAFPEEVITEIMKEYQEVLYCAHKRDTDEWYKEYKKVA